MKRTPRTILLPTMEELKEQRNTPYAYYLGDLMGRLQYKKSYETIKQLAIPAPDYTHDQYTLGYTLEENLMVHLKRLTPDTKKGRQPWELLLVMKKVEEGVIHLKGALLNTETRDIALLTSFGDKQCIIDHGNRAISSMDPSYFIGHYRMLAPLYFWEELQKRL